MDESTCVRLLEQHGVKPTSNRIVVLKALERARHPASMTELENAILTIDKSGIFRCLALFRKHRMVHTVEDGDGGVKYELCHRDDEDLDNDIHVHFFCERCRRVFCLHDMPVPRVSLPEGYTMTSVNYMVKGMCGECVRRKA